VTSASDQRAEDKRGGPRVIEGGVRGSDVEAQQLDQPRQPRRLTFGKVQHEPRER
jgi:hypothetical protein